MLAGGALVLSEQGSWWEGVSTCAAAMRWLRAGRPAARLGSEELAGCVFGGRQLGCAAACADCQCAGVVDESVLRWARMLVGGVEGGLQLQSNRLEAL